MHSIILEEIYEWRLWDTRNKSTKNLIFSEKIRKQYRVVRWINQQNWRFEKQHLQRCLISEKELKEFEKFAKENLYKEELKDIFLRLVLDGNKVSEWDPTLDQY